MKRLVHNLTAIQERVELLQNAKKIEQLSKGYSYDNKYIVFGDGFKLLLRIAEKGSYEKKMIEFQILKEMQSFNIRTPKLIDIGIFNDLNSCYTIYSYIDGIDAKEALDKLSEEEQYKLGIEAGKELSKMHLLKAPPTIKSWYERAMEKHYRYYNSYKECGIRINNDEKIINFIEKNKHCIKNRCNHFQHDDYHMGNIIVKNKKYAGVIDFGNFDWGDPIHDFVKVALFQREESVPFSIGQIEGYFDNQIPEDFWMLYSIYSGMVIFSSVVWSLRFAPEQFGEMEERIYVLLEDHKNFEILKPTWFV